MVEFPTDDGPRLSRELYEELVDLATDLTLLLDRGGTVRHVSGSVERILGYDPASLEAASLAEYTHPSDRGVVTDAIEDVGGDPGRTASFEVRVRDYDGASRWFHTVLQNPANGGIDSLLLTAREITTRKERERALETNKERLELAVEGANLGIWDWDMETGAVERDELLTEMLGYTPAEMGDHLDDWERLVHPEGERRHDEALADHVENRTPYYQCEYRMKTDSGAWKWVRTIGKVVDWDEDGTPRRAVGIHQDIDDRKRAELALREERDLFRRGPAIIFQWRDEPGWPIEYASENVEEILGYSAAALERNGKEFADLVHEDDLSNLQRETTTQSAGTKPHVSPDPYRVLTADGEVRWMLEFTTRVQRTGESPSLLGYLVDITDRKFREQKYQNLFESARDAIMVFDRDGYLDYNERTLSLFGYESGEAFLESTPWDRSPPTQPDGRDSKEKALERIEAAFEEGEAFFEWTHQRQDGTTFPSEVKLSRFEYEGEPALHALIRDISARKKRERQLAEREQKYRSLFADTRDALMLLDRDGFFDCNEQTLTLFEVESVEEFVSFAPWELSPPTQPDGTDSKRAATQQIETAFEEGEAFFEWTHERQDGSTFPAEVKLSRFQLHGEPVLHALVRDITARKEYERELKELTTRLEFALEETDTGVWEWDIETDELVGDEASERLIGYEPGTFPGTFEDFAKHIHDTDVEAVRDAIHDALQTDQEFKTDFRVQAPDGDWKWVQARGVVDYDDEGDPQRMIGIQTDITDRKEREEAIRRERELNQRMQTVLADSRTRQVLEDRVTDQLHDHGYALAWIGEQAGGELVPRAVGGGERYLETVDRDLDQIDADGLPSVQAALTGESVSVQNVSERADATWVRAAAKYNYRSCTAIPIVHRDVTYGILTLYHTEPDRFDESERELLEELTETIAFAIHSLETQDSLAADHTATVSIELAAGHYLIELAEAEPIDGEQPLTVKGTVPVDETEVVQYVELTGETPDSVERAFEAMSPVTDVRVVVPENPMRVAVTLSSTVPETFLSARGVVVNETRIDGGSARIDVQIPHDSNFEGPLEALQAEFGGEAVRLISSRTQSNGWAGGGDARSELTEKQSQALKAAYHNGYFDQPRRATATEIAESLGISHSTFLQHLHRAEEKVFEAKFDQEH